MSSGLSEMWFQCWCPGQCRGCGQHVATQQQPHNHTVLVYVHVGPSKPDTNSETLMHTNITGCDLTTTWSCGMSLTQTLWSDPAIPKPTHATQQQRSPWPDPWPSENQKTIQRFKLCYHADVPGLSACNDGMPQIFFKKKTTRKGK